MIPKDSTILVTGVNNFIASHIADQLLEDGYNVRGTVRSWSKGEPFLRHFNSIHGYGRFIVVIVDNITLDRAFNEVVRGVAEVCHVATAATLTTDPDQAISATVAGAVNLFKAAARESMIQSVIYTADSFATLLRQSNKPLTIKATDYNEYAISAAYDPAELAGVKATAWDPSMAVELVIWAAAKAFAERAVWQFVSDQKSTFQMSSVIPNMNFGPPVGNLPLSSTGKSIPDLLSNEANPDLYFPTQHFVNVRDCAKLHVAALLDPSQAGKRIFACAAPYDWNDVLHILGELRPDANIRDDFEDLGIDLSVLLNQAAEDLLQQWYGHGWIRLHETVRQSIAGL